MKHALLPIAEQHPPFAGEAWRLFQHYLAFVANWPEPSFHPCTRHLFSVYQGYQGTIEAQSMALATAVEGVVKELYPEPKKKIESTKELMKKLRAHCENWEEFKNEEVKRSLWERLSGLLGQLAGTRPKDVLYRLVADRAVNEQHVQAWNKLRNRSAHADVWSSGSVQDLVDLCSSAMILLYHLVFRAIGYEGLYTDYSVYGYPTKRYRGRPVTEGEIAIAAYFLWKQDGEKYGNDWHYWFTARKMLEEGII
jgi:hypothetical protein